MIVLGADTASLLRHAWTARAFDEGGQGWTEWCDGAVRLDRMPPRANVARMVRRWVREAGASHVRLVADPALAARQAGVRKPPPLPAEPSADAIDLARRVAAPLGLLVVPEQRRLLLHHVLLPRLAARGGVPLGIPFEHRSWVLDQAARMRETLRRPDYAGVADAAALDALFPTDDAQDGAVPDDDGVLDVALAMLLEGPTTGEVPR